MYRSSGRKKYTLKVYAVKPRLVAEVMPLHLSAQIICPQELLPRNFSNFARQPKTHFFQTRLAIIYNFKPNVNGFFTVFLPFLPYFTPFLTEFALFFHIFRNLSETIRERHNNLTFFAEKHNI